MEGSDGTVRSGGEIALDAGGGQPSTGDAAAHADGAQDMPPRPVDWNPFDPAALADPHAAHDTMRRTCPVAYSQLGWSLFEYADVLAAARNPEVFSNKTTPPEGHEGFTIPFLLDPPDHPIYRRFLNPYFSSRKALEFEPRIRAIALELLRPLLAEGGGDVIERFTTPYAMQGLCAFLGWDRAKWKELRTWFSSHFTPVAERADPARERPAQLALRSYISDVIDAKRARPADDFTSWLLQQEDPGVPLDGDVRLQILRTVMLLGYPSMISTTRTSLGHLARDLELQSRLRVRPGLIPDAIEELLRLWTPTLTLPRIATRDTEVRGRTIKAGEPVGLMLMSANRDPSVFSTPERCAIERKPNRHLAFGHGIHFCLGAPLARLMLRVALEEFLARTTRFTIRTVRPHPFEEHFAIEPSDS